VPTARDLHVGLNLTYLLNESGGAGTYARQLIPALLTAEPGLRLTAFTSADSPAWLLESEWSDQIEVVRFGVSAASGPPWQTGQVLLKQWLTLPRLARRRGVDVVHGLANIVPPVMPGVASVVSVLDVIWKHFPQTLSRRSTFGMKVVTPVSARRADRVIALTDAAAASISSAFSIPRSKFDITPLAPAMGGAVSAEQDVRTSLGLGDATVVVCVAQKREHKNLLGLIRAVARIDDPSLVLVLPGSPTPHEADLRVEANRLGVGDRVLFPAWISDADLRGLYALAAGAVLPSFEEGFGLPVLEAMASGTPVACSDIPVLREVAGYAAVFFDPHDLQQMARVITRIVRDPIVSRDLVDRGRARANEFSWDTTARATLASYRRALSGRA
jgi:glycosyltransferase involved in cell wall biosynthesis